MTHVRIPPYLDAAPGQGEATYRLTVPQPGPAVVIIWPDAPDRSSLERVARAVERALRAAWPPVPTDSPDAL